MRQFEVKRFTSIPDIERIRESWTQMQWWLEADIDFFSFIVRARPNVLRPYVLLVLENGNPVSLLAGRIETSRLPIKLGYKTLWQPPIRCLTIFYGGFMGQNRVEICELLVRQLVQSLREEKADLLIWQGVRWQSEIHELLDHVPGVLCRDYLKRPSRHWTMDLPTSLDELLEQKMSKKHRYWAKRTLRLLETDFPGQVRFVCLRQPQEVGTLFDNVMKVAKKTYQWGLGVGFQGTVENRARLELEAEKGWLRGYLLYVKNEPVAFWLCTFYKETLGLAYTGFDPNYRKYEPGTALFLWMLGENCRQRVKRLDFGTGSAFYKQRFGDVAFQESSPLIFNSTARGIFLNGLRLLTQGPVEVIRFLLENLGLEQKVKKFWRGHATPHEESRNLNGESVKGAA